MAHVAHCLLANVRSHAQDAAVILPDGGSITGTELFCRVCALADALQQEWGVGYGQRVSCLALNSHRVLELWLATAMIGAVFAPLNYRWSTAEVAAALADVRSAALFVDEANAGVLDSADVSRALAEDRARVGFLGPPLEGRSTLPSTERAIAPQVASTMAACSKLLGPSSSRSQGSDQASGWDFLPSSILGVPSQEVVKHVPPESVGTMQSDRNLPLVDLLNARASFRHAPADVALLVFTSGTTGRSKAAALTHAAVVFQSACKIAHMRLTSADVYMHAPPLFHVGGLSSAHAALQCAARHVFPPKFAAADFLAQLRQWGVSSIAVVPTMLGDMVKAARLDRNGQEASAGSGSAAPWHDASPLPSIPSVRHVLVGAGKLPASLVRSASSLFPRATFHTAYGMTEACSSITFGLAGGAVPAESLALAWDHQRQLLEGLTAGGAGGDGGRGETPSGMPSHVVNVGFPPAGIEVRVVASDGASGAGVEGEVQVRGPNVTLGYARASSADGTALSVSRTPLTPEGWLQTGDAGVMSPSGRLWLVGRLKDVVRSGGENVHAGEVEEVLQRMRGVEEAAVFGVPDERLGETVAAVLVVQRAGGDGVPGAPLQSMVGTLNGAAREVVTEHCRREGLSGFKCPRVVMVTDRPLPRNSMGKVDKGVLREAYRVGVAQSPGAGRAGMPTAEQ